MNKTIIKVDYSVRKEIMEILNVSYPTIRRALNNETNTEIAKKIRQVALAKGGLKFKKA